MTRNKNGGIKAMLAVFIAMFVLLAGYLVYIIDVYGAYWFASPYNTRVTKQKNAVIAGSISDRRGVTLAESDSYGARHYSTNDEIRLSCAHAVGDSSNQTLGAQALLLHLGQTAAAETQAEAYSSEQVRVVHEVHAYLTQNLDTRVTIEELSRQYLMNPTTLKAVFKSVYGASLAAHMKEHRMGKAAQLLRESDESVAEIARAVGYESQSKFTAAFKEYFGLLPKEYRRNH